MKCKIVILLVHLSFIATIWSHPVVDEDENPELGPYFEGDILDPPTEEELKSGLTDLKRRWPNKTLVYRIGSDFTTEERGFISEAMKEIQGKTCIRFRMKKVKDLDHAVFSKVEKGCSSAFGRKGGKQEIRLAATCFMSRRHGTVMHEIIHALGFGHEHIRPDRDNFVTILWNKIQRDERHNFWKSKLANRTFGIPYDYGSIMHYSRDAFAEKRGETTTLVKTKGAEIGQRKALSERDVKKLKRLYECPK